MKISFIIPVYNSEQYLISCVESIVNHLSLEYEVMLIDDGSTDLSTEICDRLSIQDSRIRVFHLRNGGVSKARNFGLEKAKGDYIRFIDSDDCMSGEWTQALISDGLEADWLTMNAEVVDASEHIVRNIDVGTNRICTVQEMLLTLNEQNKPVNLHYLWNHLYKRQIIEDNKIRFNEDVSLGEDFLFNCEYLRHCGKIEYRSVNCYKYYKRNFDSLTTKFHKDELERRRIMDNALVALYKEYGLYEQKKTELGICIGGITIGALESVCTKNCNLKLRDKLKYISDFYNSEYYMYLMDYINYSKSRSPEMVFIRHKRRLELYLYVKIKALIKSRK